MFLQYAGAHSIPHGSGWELPILRRDSERLHAWYRISYSVIYLPLPFCRGILWAFQNISLQWCTVHTAHLFLWGGLTSSPRAVTKCNRSNNCIISRIQALTDGTCNLHHFHVENTFAESFCVFNFDHNYDFVSW